MTLFSEADHRHMRRALELAERGRYTTQPNPRVGCVLVQGDEVVGEGWHHRAGEPHAEVHALRQAGERADGATAYVTLEPCAHTGRTGPCCVALIDARVSRVVVAHEDPFHKVNGQGSQALREAGIAVELGLLREPARELNIGFLWNMQHGRPWVRVKFGMSADGRTGLSNGISKWITGPQARSDVQEWRSRSSAILSGSGTVLADDPQLTVREPRVAQAVPPVRVILDRRLAVAENAQVLDGSVPTLVLHAAGLQPKRAADSPVEYLGIADTGSGLDLNAVMTELGRRGLHEVLVEAGPTLSGSLLAAGLVDEILLYMAPKFLGDDAQPLLRLPALTRLEDAPQFALQDVAAIGPDVRIRLRNRLHVPAG